MAHPDSDSDGPNPSKSFSVGAADRLSGFFTPVWESKRRRSIDERELPSDPAAAHEPPAAPVPAEAQARASRSEPPPAARQSQPPAARKSDPPAARKSDPPAARQSQPPAARKSDPPSPRLPMPAQRRSSAPPAPVAKVVVRSEDLADTPASSELPAAALVDSKPELLGDPRGVEPMKTKAAAPRPVRAEVPRPATPATLGRNAERAPARRSSIPPAPAERRSSVPPAPLASATPEAEPTRGSKPPIPRPATARALEQSRAAAVTSTMAGGAEVAGRDEATDRGAQARPGSVPPVAAETSPVTAVAGAEAAVAEAAATEAAAADAAAADAPEAERETLLGVLPTAADELAAAAERETLLGVPAAKADVPVPRRSETPPAVAQRAPYTVSSYANESRALMTSGPAYGAREAHSSEWDSPDTLPRPAALGEGEQGATPEMRVAHLLRRLRRTIPLYAPLPENIRKLIDSDQSQ
jgi:hypothetical protein